MLLKKTIYCSFLHFDARLTFPEARLRLSQPRLQEYWFFVLGAIFNSKDFSCSFLHFDDRLSFPQARLVSLPTSPAGILIFRFGRNFEFRTFLPVLLIFPLSAPCWMKTLPAVCWFPFLSVILNPNVFRHKCEGRTFLPHQHLKALIENEVGRSSWREKMGSWYPKQVASMKYEKRRNLRFAFEKKKMCWLAFWEITSFEQKLFGPYIIKP